MNNSTTSGNGRSGAPQGAASGGIYGVAFLGALVYYIQAADSLWTGFLGVLKALFWPAFFVYELLDYIGA